MNSILLDYSRICSLVYLFALLFMGTSGLLQAQIGDGALKDNSAWKMTSEPAGPFKVGDVVTVHFETPIEKGFHIYSVKAYPAGKVGPTATTFALDKETTGIERVGGLADVGKFETVYDDIFETDIYQFVNKVKFSQKFRITAANPMIVGVLRYQICNEMGCLYGTYDLDIKPKMLASATENTSDQQTNPDQNLSVAADTLRKDSSELVRRTKEYAQNIDAGNTIGATADLPAKSEDSGWFSGFLIAFLAGLASLITPCVFPMIPMTVSFFTKRSGSRAKGIRNAFMYSGSIISIFVVLGLTVTAMFGTEAIYNISTNPYMNLILFGIIFAFGLSFLGLFDLTLPSSWVTAMDKKSDKGGIAGIFFMALTLVLASFSCVGPIAGLILIDASDGEVWGPAIGMMGYSAGFALPFGMFALFPGMLQSLPKSGGWLNSVKVVLGLLELALALKFLSMADLYWHLGLLDREIFIAIWVAIFGAMSLYLLGKIRLSHDTNVEKLSVPRMVLSLVAISFVFYLIPGLWGSPLSKLSGILPPPNREIGVRIAPVFASNSNQSGKGQSVSQNPVCNEARKYADKLSGYAPDGYCMFYNLAEAQAYSRKVNKPIMIDFTGHTCANCRQMEHQVWPDQRVKKILTEEYVIASLYVDDNTELPETIVKPDGKKIRTVGDEYRDLQISNFRVFAQPYYFLTDADLNLLVPEGVGYTPDIDEYLAYLNKGLQNFRNSSKTSSNQ